MQKELNKIVLLILIWFSGIVRASDTIHLFPLQNYDQNPAHFFNPDSPDYNEPLIARDVTEKRAADYKEHLFGALSPWSEKFVTSILNKTPPEDIQGIETVLFSRYRKGCNTDLAGSFAENFKPYSCQWFDDKILKKMNLNQFHFPIKYDKDKKAIVVDNILARSFPTNEPLFFSYKLAGEGYPFDNLQVSSVWLGTPSYVLGQTDDAIWSLVITESGFIAWVPSQKIAKVDDSFISEYVRYVDNYGLRAITHTETNIQESGSGASLHTSYVGSIFPAKNDDVNQVMIPKRKENGFAQLIPAVVGDNYSAFFPMSATPKNFSTIFSELLGRPYGWGGMYFYNDCSQETQSIFATFGVWLPRNSADQVNVGKVQDLSPQSSLDRIKHLSSDARKLVTLVYIKGHIMLYVGNYNYFGTIAPTVYNNLWGLRPSDNSYRSIIGQASFFPLLSSFLYPEDKNLISLFDSAYRPLFKLSFLDEFDENKPRGLSQDLDAFEQKIDLRHMILPENF